MVAERRARRREEEWGPVPSGAVGGPGETQETQDARGVANEGFDGEDQDAWEEEGRLQEEGGGKDRSPEKEERIRCGSSSWTESEVGSERDGPWGAGGPGVSPLGSKGSGR